MKRVISKLLIMLILLTAEQGIAQIITTPNIQHLTSADGLVSDEIMDVLIEDNGNVWIATIAGLSHYDGTTFTNYSSQNSTMLNDNLKELELAQNKIWMISDSGLTSFDGTSFMNYTISNGLLSSVIEGIAVTSTDTLWISTTKGTSKFDGTTFVNYTAQTGRDIEVDNMDRVYVMRATVANNFSFVHLYENGAWSQPAPTGINFGFSGAKLSKTVDNNLYVSGVNIGDYFKIDYPLNLQKRTIYIDSTTLDGNSVLAINLLQIEETNGLFFIGGGGENSPLYHVSIDSNFIGQYVRPFNAISSSIDVKGNVLVIGSDSGLFLTQPTIKNEVNHLPFSVNQIRTSASLTDALFTDVLRGSSDFAFPKDSNTHGIFAANFIVAAKQINQNSFLVHPQSGFGTTYNPGPISNVGGLAGTYMFKLTKQEILDHKARFDQIGYTMPDGIRDWPAFGDTTLGVAPDLAPFVDINSNDCYDPMNGDYPIIKGDEAIYWINHPTNQNLELEYHWMMYGFDNPSNKNLDQTIFLQYTIINRSLNVYDSLKVGFFLDADIGIAIDDYVGTDSLNNLLYFYNGDVFDEDVNIIQGFGNKPPAVGVKFLSDSLESTVHFNIGTGINGDPTMEQDWINYLNGRWRNGQSIIYGGDGFNGGFPGVPTSHVFTGDPFTQTGWTEVTPLTSSGLSNAPGDRRGLGVMPHFALQPNERKTIEVAVGYGQINNTNTAVGENVTEMRSVLNAVELIWDTLSVPTPTFASTDSCVVTSITENILQSNKNLTLYPVPASTMIHVKSFEKLNEIQLYNMEGALIRKITADKTSITIDVGDLKGGIYLLNTLSKEGIQSKKFMILR